MKIGDESAFPVPHSHHESGLSKREYFAGLAMQVIFGSPRYTGNSDDLCVEYAVRIADKLILQLNREDD